MLVLETVNPKNSCFFIVVPVVLGEEVLQIADVCICVSNITFLNSLELLIASIRFQKVNCLRNVLSSNHIFCRRVGLYTTLWLPRINWQKSVWVCVCGCCIFSFFPQLWDEIWGETDKFPSVCFICKKKKKSLLVIQIYALATFLLQSLSCSSIFLSLSKWHLWMTRVSIVSGAEGEK